ncbi:MULTISPECIES: DNA cytosine methyltransferase [Calothrix]|uniref:DNA (cytosine-5-)-methyltransferase n=2 Tax=Calothrix TaxID=1186 RepID=A0ABR8A876_9CYAN|nr:MULTISPECIES: DNA (cytosine-5-)-methyltransferase [Calothrix]MBD2195251.1 DNA (cytosine-5-)-methyltransferase [Calothrix parietina FACHB-288]MBD2223778.1 DNA (cytosine-5-)-methyltransferase [Calothrix anomala FACHB-343]
MKLEKTAADFFAGIGLVTMGLIKQGWQVEYALDYSNEKQKMYEENFGVGHYCCKDIKQIRGIDIPRVTLAHASFPCTNISVAGSRSGLNSGESSTFWEFIRIINEMGEVASVGKPPIILIENVEGFLTSGSGEDLIIALKALNNLGYTVDILLIDAAYFVPQSRVRLFIIGNLFGLSQNRNELDVFISKLIYTRPQKIKDFIVAHPEIKWSLSNLPDLPKRIINLADIVDETEEWWTKERTEYLFNQMFARHQEQIRLMMNNEYFSYGTVFRRMRVRNGIKQSTAELRIDGIAGCLRTPKGGSARQILVRFGKGRFDARLINARESAHLMGAPEYLIPEHISFNNILFGFGDAVCVPVIEWIAQYYLNLLFEQLNSTITSEELAA